MYRPHRRSTWPPSSRTPQTVPATFCDPRAHPSPGGIERACRRRLPIRPIAYTCCFPPTLSSGLSLLLPGPGSPPLKTARAIIMGHYRHHRHSHHPPFPSPSSTSSAAGSGYYYSSAAPSSSSSYSSSSRTCPSSSSSSAGHGSSRTSLSSQGYVVRAIDERDCRAVRFAAHVVSNTRGS